MREMRTWSVVSSRIALSLGVAMAATLLGGVLPGSTTLAQGVTTIAGGAMSRINAHTACRLIANGVSSPMAIPHSQPAEWIVGTNSFLAVAPGAADIFPCPNAPISASTTAICFVSPVDNHTRCVGGAVESGMRGDGSTAGTNHGGGSGGRYTEALHRVDTSASGDFFSLSVNYNSACGLSASGVWCWGHNFGNRPVLTLPGSFTKMYTYARSASVDNGAYPCAISSSGPMLCATHSNGIVQQSPNVRDYMMPLWGNNNGLINNHPQCRITGAGGLQCRGDFTVDAGTRSNTFGNLGDLGGWTNIDTGGRVFEKIIKLEWSSWQTVCTIAVDGEIACFGAWAANATTGYPAQNNSRLTNPQWLTIATGGQYTTDPLSANGACFSPTANPSARHCIQPSYFQGSTIYLPEMVPVSAHLAPQSVRFFTRRHHPSYDFDADSYVDNQGRLFYRGCIVHSWSPRRLCSDNFTQMPQAN